MYTRCPNCHQKQSLTVAQLRVTRAIVFCKKCLTQFDALELLCESEQEETGVPLNSEVLPWEKEARPQNPYWRIGLVFSVLLFVGQVAFFEGDALARSEKLRPGLETLCRQLGCRLPAYKNSDELAIMQHSFSPLPDRTYLFRMIVNNQAAFMQPYPNIALTLLDYNGMPFTHRLFRPQDYLFSAATASIAADDTADIRLSIAATDTAIGGYRFDLTY